jgi:hypothetical protein
VEVPDAALPAMKRSLALMLCALALHVALTVCAALALSTAAWGFISGTLLYMLFGGVALWQFVGSRLAARAVGAHPGSGRLACLHPAILKR